MKSLVVRALCSAVACLALAGPAAAQYSAFYAATDAELAGGPGTVIRWEPISGSPRGSKAYRVLYRSTGLQGAPIAVSGVVVVPDTAAAAAGGSGDEYFEVGRRSAVRGL
jgi:hypothetical protein